jgi:hypothetical protein
MELEALVVLRGALPLAAGPWRVVASLPPRVVLVQIDDANLAALKSRADVAATTTAAAQAESLQVTPPLSDTEQLFAAAWAARGKKSQTRRGDALDWDAPGFEPPDKPPR